jgi:hypothetical protein
MKMHRKGFAVVAALVLLVGVASTALAIEAFQERFEWGDMSKPTTITGRVIILDPYDEAVWLNVAVYGGNAESNLFWQRVHPGKNLKFYAGSKEVWEQLKSLARPHAGPAAAKEVPPATQAALVEVVAQEVEQNKRVIQSVKKVPDINGEPGKPRGIRTIGLEACKGKNDYDKECYEAKRSLNTAGKGRDVTVMQYDVLIPGGKTYVSGLTPWSANEDTIGDKH